MAPGPWVLFLGMVAVVAGLPLWFATLRPDLRTNLLYGFLGVLQLLRGFFAVSYLMPLTPDLVVAPNNVFYTGIMLTAILLVLVERRTAVLRTVILVLLATEAIKLVAFATTRWALGSREFINVVGVAPEMFSGIIHVSGLGNLLIIAELFVAVAILEQVRRRTQKPRLLSLWSVGVFAVLVVADGVLFPILTDPLDVGLLEVITEGVQRKVLLAAVFGAMALAFVLLRPAPSQRHVTTSLRLRDVLFAPRHRLVARLEQQEQERVELLERTLHVAEDERRRLAEDLHDDAIQLLTAADIRLQRAAASSPGLDIGQIQDLLRGGVGSLRRLILELRGPDVTAGSFEPLVGAYVERLVGDAGLEVGIDVDLPAEVPGEVVAGAYRIVLEALSNAFKHAEAEHVEVQVHTEDDLLVGRVVDDGLGISPEAETGPGHLGLRAMEDRAAVLGGRVDVFAADGGTVVAFELPLAAPREPEELTAVEPRP